MSDLLRHRVTSQDGAPARFDESETGYWTPWHIAERRCNDLRARLEQAETRMAELVLDAMRYRFIRDNQCWQRTEPYYDEPGYDLIGVKFERDNGFTAKAYLDFAIDKRLRQQAAEAERAGGEK